MYSQFSLFTIVTLSKVTVIVSPELANTELLLLGGNTGLGAYKPLVTTFLSTN